jgi:hypothetical protein
MVSICCSPPLKNPARRVSISRRAGKKFVDSFLGPGIRTIFSSFGNFQVFTDRQIGKDPPIVPDITDSPAGHHIRFLPRAICAFEFDRAFARRRNAHTDFHGCAFTCTVSAEQADDLARGNFQGHPEQNVAQSIIGMDIIDFID